MRTLSDDVIAQLRANLVQPVVLVQMQFDSGPIYMWSGIGGLSWNGQTWLGMGSLGKISTVPENASIQADGIKLELSGIDPTLLPAALGTMRHGYMVTVYFGFLASDAIVADPVVAFYGRTDAVTIYEGADTATITVNVENRMLDLQRIRPSRFTDEEQERLHPGDRGFEYVNTVQAWNGAWGKRV